MESHSTDGALRFGEPLAAATGVVILLHGRGASASDMAGLARRLPGDAGLAYIAPNATGNTWYPQRFFFPLAQNEPWLSDALAVVGSLVGEAVAAGIPSERVALIGFSQGACLSLESAARQPRRYGFVAALSGALIGPAGGLRKTGDLAGTPILLGCAERDPHIPIEYVKESAVLLEGMGAKVTTQVYPGEAHTVFAPEMQWINEQIRLMSP